MHDLDRTQLESYGETFGTGFELGDETGVLTEADELELATELLTVSNEEELDQFLGKLFKKVGKIARGPLGGLLKSVAKKALPIVGGALGSAIPIPGIGTMIGTAAGNAAANMFEVNLEGMSQEDQEFEIARRVVRLASSAAANAGPAAATLAGAKAALMDAARAHAPGLVNAVVNGRLVGGTNGAGSRTGRWIRRGHTIILLNV